MLLDLNEVIGEVLRLSRAEAVERRVEIESDLAAELTPLAGDRVQLQQLIQNLLFNGFEAMEPVIDRPRKLVIRSRQDNPEAILVEIQDNGVGMGNRTGSSMLLHHERERHGYGLGHL